MWDCSAVRVAAVGSLSVREGLRVLLWAETWKARVVEGAHEMREVMLTALREERIS